MNKEWITEPARKDFESNGFKCHIKRHPSLLHLCGYVSIPKTHKLYGVDYSSLYEMGIDISVHGGITYAEKEGNSWVFGFDCAHLGDLVPLSIHLGYSLRSETYKNMEYVEKETMSLARQLAELS